MKKNTILKGIGIAAGIAAALALAYLGWCVSLEDEVIWSPCVINGTALEGMTEEEANTAIAEQFQEDYEDAVMTITIADKEFDAEIFPLLGLDASEIITEAYQLGHGKWYTRGLDWYRRYQKGDETDTYEIFPAAAHPEKITEVIEKTGIQDVDTLVESTWEIGKTSITLHKGSTGVTADTKKLGNDILEAIERQNYTAALSCPVIETAPKDVDFHPFYDEIYQEKKDAVLDVSKNCRVIPSQEGISFDIEEAEKTFQDAAEGETVVIDYVFEKPSLTTKELREKLYRDELGSYTTYGGGTSNRITNLTLAAKSCDGVTLMPGETFSYNETLGERTAENGYKSATVYVNGQTAEGLGGGICQVSTTLFVAALYADLEIVQRSNHSLTVSYVPMGMDAAVSWGGPDLQIRNNTDYPVRFSVAYEDGAIHASVIGTKENDETVEITTRNLDGLSAKTYRSHYDRDGNLISSEEVAYSKYKGGH